MKHPFQNHIPLEPGMVILLGIPWDENSSFLRGPALAPARIREVLRCIREADEGISIIVSGLIDQVRDIGEEIGLDPHTINISLGILGNTDRLPPAELRQYTTMCGHGMVSPNLVRDVLRKVKTGKISAWDGSLALVAPCICGIVNPHRSEEMLKETLPLYTTSRW